MIATCPTCRNTGAIGERYCSCEAAQALRARDDQDPAVLARRAEIQRLLDEATPMFVRVPIIYAGPAANGVAQLDDD